MKFKDGSGLFCVDVETGGGGGGGSSWWLHGNTLIYKQRFHVNGI